MDDAYRAVAPDPDHFDAGVIDGNISSATACMPSLVYDADATTILRTTVG